jgi:acyl-CoA reductase-like NAD-dependent aldehyde dehydrogenase
MSEFTMTIAGEPASSSSTIEVVNPATGEAFAEAPNCERAQLNTAMESAREAFTHWRGDLEVRRKLMHEAAAALEARTDELGRLATSEQGQILAMADGTVKSAVRMLRSYADIELPRYVVQDDEIAFVEVVHEPIGVIAAIKPWNVPIAMAMATVAPALRAGCTVVLKPSPYTPLVTLRLGEILRDVLPPGVLNVVSGADPLGEWMVNHPIPRGISFTGSIATGKRVNEAAARDLKRVLLELGGNDAAIVLDDVDPEEVADGLFQGAFTNSGQVCMGIKRVFVPEEMHDALASALARRAESTVLGNGLDQSSQLGPINNRPQLERVTEIVDEAIAAGGKALAGGQPLPTPGYFYPPTIVTGVAEGTRLVDDEQFGPALPLLPYQGIDEAIERANATSFGLGSSVWSNDHDRAAAVAERLEAGTTWINTHARLSPTQPFVGTKWSGLGAGNGRYAVETFSNMHTLYWARTSGTSKK